MGGDAHPSPSPSFSLHLLSSWRDEEVVLVLPSWQQELLLVTTPLLRSQLRRQDPACKVGPQGEVAVVAVVVVEEPGPGRWWFHLLWPHPQRKATGRTPHLNSS